MAGKEKNLGSNAKRRFRRNKAGLKFPVFRIARFLKVGKYDKGVGAGAPVFSLLCLSTLQLRFLNWLELQRGMKKRLVSLQGIFNWLLGLLRKLYKFLRDVTILNGGIIPKIQKNLLPNNKSNTSKVVVAAQEEED
uniref:Histone H2A n=1 Tax=Solanum lycopersicum TaxID=4081 RepID=K4BYK0_SOLLC